MIGGNPHAVRALLLDPRVSGDLARAADAVELEGSNGDPEAALLAAVLYASGYARAKDWSVALDWLLRAAVLGSSLAQAQLQLLAELDGDDWRSLRALVDIGALTAARPAALISVTPRIGVAAKFIEAPVCRWLIARGGPLQQPSRVYGSEGAPVCHEIRGNTQAALTVLTTDLVALMVRERIANTMGVPVAHFERFSIFRYETGQSFARHVDYLDPVIPQLQEDLMRRGQRCLTFLIYLNDDFDGGETTFLRLGRKVRGGAGDGVFFYSVGPNGEPDPLTLHEGSPPTRGEKWLASQFIRDRPQAQG